MEVPMPLEPKCSQCGGTDLEPGSIQSTGKVYFRPANAKFLTLSTGGAVVNANVCLSCGHIDLVADVKKLSALTQRAKPF
jgi:hypothetical protein